MEHIRRMKDRLRCDLTAALKARRGEETAVLRTLLAAIDNAEAPALASGPASGDPAAEAGPSEIERLALTPEELHRILADEVRGLEQGAARLAALGQSARAQSLRAQAAIAARYLEQPVNR